MEYEKREMTNLDNLIARLRYGALDETDPFWEAMSKAAARIEELVAEREDWARSFKLNDITPWEWMTRAERAEAERDALAKLLTEWIDIGGGWIVGYHADGELAAANALANLQARTCTAIDAAMAAKGKR